MGQQQLLLIALSVIIVGAAVAVGVNMLNEGATQADADKFYQKAVKISTEFAAWYKKPVAMGGAGGDITQFPTYSTGSREIASILGCETAKDSTSGLYISAITAVTDNSLDDPSTSAKTETLNGLSITLTDQSGGTGIFDALPTGNVDWTTRP